MFSLQSAEVNFESSREDILYMWRDDGSIYRIVAKIVVSVIAKKAP